MDKKQFLVVIDTQTNTAKITMGEFEEMVTFTSLDDEWQGFFMGDDEYDIHVYNEGDNFDTIEVAIYDVIDGSPNTLEWHDVTVKEKI